MTASVRGEAVVLELHTDPLMDEPLTELGHARRLVAVAGPRIRFVAAWSQWLVWDGQRWRPDDTGEVARIAKLVARSVTKRTAAALSATCASEEKAELRAALRLESSSSIAGTLKLASTELGISVTPGRLDAHPTLINVANGVLDLATGELREHDRELLMTKLAPAAYQSDAKAPHFDKFIERIVPDQEMRVFLARLLGHALLGRVAEHLLPVLFGSGANGKSTLIAAVMSAMGDYAGTADPTLLIDRGHESHPTGVADLFGRRVVFCHETDDGRRLAEGTVKRLTGGDVVKARRMRQDFWEFTPSHSLFLVTNHKPKVRGNDDGIWRRLLLVSFTESIPDDEQDGGLGDKLAAERDGILAWLVQGYTEWQSIGLAIPTAVVEATGAYRHEEDLVGRFIEERCVIAESARIQSSHLFAEWADWCRGEGNPEAARTQTWFSGIVENRGYEKGLKSGLMVWRRLGLKAVDSDDNGGGEG